jgi:hypothetical protein
MDRLRFLTNERDITITLVLLLISANRSLLAIITTILRLTTIYSFLTYRILSPYKSPEFIIDILLT